MKKIVLAEKPSVGKDLARVLGCRNGNKGYIEGNDYIVTWAMGHLVELADPESYDEKYKRWSLDTLPMLPERMRLKVIRKTSKQFNTIKRLFGRNDTGELIVATDAGREGELVARWIMKLCSWKGAFKRLWINSQTDRAIKEGFATLLDGRQYDNLFLAAECRAEADWLIGLNISRALSCKHEVRLSAGRVQTPTLTLVANREKEIKEFVPQPFWTVTADFGPYQGMWTGKNGATRIKEQQRAREIVEKVRGATGTIVDVDIKDKKTDPPLAYDLTSLQGDANRILSFSAKKTLQTLQNLYERHKIVTYPRTDSKHITNDMVPTLPDRLKALEKTSFRGAAQERAGWIAGGSGGGGPGAGGAAGSKNPNIVTKRFVDDSKVTDHHAIIPTEEKVVLDRLDRDERALWQLIVSRFLEVLSPPYRYKQIKITTEAAGESFVSRGKKVIDLGWKKIGGGGRIGRNDDDETGDEDTPDQPLGEHTKGEQHQVQSADTKQGRTKPPPRYTEGTLLAAMENAGKFIDDTQLKKSIAKGGLGTPATRAEIIEKIISHYYVERQGKELVPTSRGLELLDLVPTHLTEPELTAEWELRLSKIEKGEEKHTDFLKDIRNETRSIVDQVKKSTAVYNPRGETKEKCPLCGRPLYPIKGRRGKRLLVCQGLSCGYEEEEGGKEKSGGKPSQKEQKIARRLMREYNQEVKETATFADLIKQAEARKKK